MGPTTPEDRRWPSRAFVLGALAAILLGAVLLQVLLQPTNAATTTSTTTAVGAVSTTGTTSAPTTSSTSPIAQSTAGTTLTTAVYTHAIAEPSRVVIPAIKADALIVNAGVLDDGSMDVPPFGLAGWFHVGPAPGEPGPAVIVGHVDSKKGPDVFYRLKDLKPGDEVFVYDKSGDLAVFVVDSSETILKSELPTERIWNSTPQPVIRLITCGGKFDRSTGHYLSNTIVYGHLVR
jgi:Sortase domain